LFDQAREKVIVKPAALSFIAAALAAGQALVPLDEPVFARTLQAEKGKVVLFNFWATWCEPCRVELPKLVQLEKDLSARGFVLITISADEPEQEASALQFLKQSGARLPAFIKRVRDNDAFINAIDGKWSGALPALFLYDRENRRVTSFFGETEIADIEKAIEKLF
jgi:cytochrome c biogenesis protein CcmG, thiol:disulfide interchange protein DsbE